jgi:hypothetical protein
MTNKTEQSLQLKAAVDGALGVGPTTLAVIEMLVLSLAPHMAPDLNEEDLDALVHELIEVTECFSTKENDSSNLTTRPGRKYA